MPKYYRKKRSFRPKRRTRVFRKKRMASKKSSIRYDGMIKVKLSAFKELDNTDANGIATMNVNWGD